MSASLVGSEMCIRDRRSTSLAYRWVGWPVGHAADGRALRSIIGAWCRLCLLYTSDAADDM
eukprot:14048341-Alexandrium_andersonii.AAC.1